jgi:hypothetical protein
MLEKIKKFLEVCQTIREWCKKHPITAIIIGIVLLGLIVAVILFIRWLIIAVFPFLAIAAIIVLACRGEQILDRLFPDPILPPLTLDNNEVCRVVTKFMFDSVSSVRSAISDYVKIPHTVNDMYDNAGFREVYSGVPLLLLHVLRTKNDVSDEDCEYIKNVLQGSVKARLNDGNLVGYLWAVPVASDIPLIKIATVEVSELYIHFGVLLTNTKKSVNAARISDKPTLPPSVDDTDPLFK